MARIFFVHWNKEEALERVRALREAGHTLIYHYSTGEGAGAKVWGQIRSHPPDAFVISMARLPSHGRRIAAVIAETKALRAVPLIFLDGAVEKIAAARAQFPQAMFTTSQKLNRLLQTLGERNRKTAATRSA